MATDYDAPRTQPEDEPANESLEAIQAQRSTPQTAVIDLEDADTAEGIDLPGADLSHEELTVAVVPEQADEFTCGSWLPGPPPLPARPPKGRREVLH
jgi:hypothetical protein